MMGKIANSIMSSDSSSWWEEFVMAYFTSLSCDNSQDTEINHELRHDMPFLRAFQPYRCISQIWNKSANKNIRQRTLFTTGTQVVTAVECMTLVPISLQYMLYWLKLYSFLICSYRDLFTEQPKVAVDWLTLCITFGWSQVQISAHRLVEFHHTVQANATDTTTHTNNGNDRFLAWTFHIHCHKS
jgi:hypothetical protein